VQREEIALQTPEAELQLIECCLSLQIIHITRSLYLQGSFLRIELKERSGAGIHKVG